MTETGEVTAATVFEHGCTAPAVSHLNTVALPAEGTDCCYCDGFIV